MTQERIVVISGASSGIGKALAEQLAAAGDRVYGLARRVEDSAPDATGRLLYRQADVTDTDRIQTVLQDILVREKRIDLLVLAAGYGLAGAVEAMTAQEAHSQMATNYLGVSNLLSPVLTIMREQGAGRIVLISSVAAFMPLPYQACYSASKAAANALVRAAANENRPHGLSFMVVQPGDTRTGFTASRVTSPKTLTLPDADRYLRSIGRMAADEQKGPSADDLARWIIHRINRRRMPIQTTPGAFYRLTEVANRLLPVRLIQWILYRLYAR